MTSSVLMGLLDRSIMDKHFLSVMWTFNLYCYVHQQIVHYTEVSTIGNRP